MIQKTKLYVLFHDQRSKESAQPLLSIPGAVPKKLGGSLFLESQVYTWLLKNEQDWEKEDYVGILPYSICHKQNITEGATDLVRTHFQKADKDADVVSFYKQFDQPMWVQTRRHHSNLDKAWVALLSRMGGIAQEVALSNSIPFYQCSSWAAKPGTMKSFLVFAERAMSIMSTDKTVRDLCFEDSQYPGSGLSKDDCNRNFGVPYYPMFPFIMERLPCFYFWYSGSNVWTGNLHRHPECIQPTEVKKKLNILYFLAAFGPPRLASKLEILKHNLQTLRAQPSVATLDVVLNTYGKKHDMMSLETAVRSVAPGCRIYHHHQEKAVLVQLWTDQNPHMAELRASAQDRYDHVVFTLDDVRIERLDVGDSHQLYRQLKLDILSPVVRGASNSQGVFDFPPTGAGGGSMARFTNATEFFVYFCSPGAFFRLLDRYDESSPWMWGFDLLLGFWGFKTAVYSAGLVTHLWKDSMKFNHYKERCMQQVLKKNGFPSAESLMKRFPPIASPPFFLQKKSELEKGVGPKQPDQESRPENDAIWQRGGRILVVYAFYQDLPRVRSFLRRAFSMWRDDVDFVAVCNSPDLVLPCPDHVRYINRANTGFDFGAWSSAVAGCVEEYDYFVFVNQSVCGPYAHGGRPWTVDNSWVDVFVEGLRRDRCDIFGSCINFGNHLIRQPPGVPHVQSYAFALTQRALKFLFEKNIFSTVHTAMTKNEAIIKEIRMSLVLQEEGWRIGCLMPVFRPWVVNQSANENQLSWFKSLGNISVASKHYATLFHESDVVFVKPDHPIKSSISDPPFVSADDPPPNIVLLYAEGWEDSWPLVCQALSQSYPHARTMVVSDCSGGPPTSQGWTVLPSALPPGSGLANLYHTFLDTCPECEQALLLEPGTALLRELPLVGKLDCAPVWWTSAPNCPPNGSYWVKSRVLQAAGVRELPPGPDFVHNLQRLLAPHSAKMSSTLLRRNSFLGPRIPVHSGINGVMPVYQFAKGPMFYLQHSVLNASPPPY